MGRNQVRITRSRRPIRRGNAAANTAWPCGHQIPGILEDPPSPSFARRFPLSCSQPDAAETASYPGFSDLPNYGFLRGKPQTPRSALHICDDNRPPVCRKVIHLRRFPQGIDVSAPRICGENCALSRNSRFLPTPTRVEGSKRQPTTPPGSRIFGKELTSICLRVPESPEVARLRGCRGMGFGGHGGRLPEPVPLFGLAERAGVLGGRVARLYLPQGVPSSEGRPEPLKKADGPGSG